MHRVYYTEGVVLGNVSSGESNKYLSLFTKDFGLVFASAQGLRRVESKLRYSLQDFSHANLNMVLGKSGWRVVSAENIRSTVLWRTPDADSEPFMAFVRICRLLKRLLRGEEQNTFLYNHILETFESLNATNLSREEVFRIELIGVMRVLHYLGYWGEQSILSPYLQGSIREKIKAPEMGKIKSLAVREINKSLRETQL